MLPVIAIVGRPNVGKSTLFNCLTKSRQALVADLPGLTRDRLYGQGQVGEKPYIVIDTGGLSGEEAGIDGHMASQAFQAVQEADWIFFMVDARAGVTPSDEWVASELRQYNKKIFLVVNKIDSMQSELATADFYSMGFGEPQGIAAAHQRGVPQLMETVLEQVYAQRPEDEVEVPLQAHAMKVAVVGRPNVGKSTLINRLLGEERVVVYDMPGTTRDSIYIPFERRGEHYTLIDTAGVRRKGRVDNAVEKFSVIKTLQAIEDANVVLFLIDGTEGLTDQDMHLLGFILEAGRSLVVVINKWDGLEASQKEWVKKELERKLRFVKFARVHCISALHGSGVGLLYDLAHEAYNSANADMSTSRLTRLLQLAIQAHQPPLYQGRRLKMRYAHTGGHNPPIIVVHGNQLDHVPEAYERYLEGYFRDALKLIGTPVRIEFKCGDNPFADRKNKLTQSQWRHKQRMLKFFRKKDK